MLYEVAVVNANRTIILDTRGLYSDKIEATTYKNLHKYEVADDEEMVVIEKSIDSLENVPSTIYVWAQTFTRVIENENMDPPIKPVTSTTIEGIITQLQSISLPDKEKLEEGKAIAFRDDEYVEDSFTVYYPISSKRLLDGEYSKNYLCEVARKIAIEAKKETKDKEVYEVENFEINNY